MDLLPTFIFDSICVIWRNKFFKLIEFYILDMYRIIWYIRYLFQISPPLNLFEWSFFIDKLYQYYLKRNNIDCGLYGDSACSVQIPGGCTYICSNYNSNKTTEKTTKNNTNASHKLHLFYELLFFIIFMI